MAKKAKKKAPAEPVQSEEVAVTEQEETPETVAETAAAEEAEDSVEAQLRADLQQAQEEAASLKDQYLRTVADMENLRKRTQREKEELAKFANENILRDILDVVDNLERAVDHAEQAEMGETGAGLLEGVQMTLTQFSQVLKKYGVEPVEALGKPFDPALHQAMGQLETEEHPANAVAQELQKGYTLNDRLLRPSMVMVAKAPAVPETETTATDDNENV